uniref:CHHC U11-48K-type domain-containing protein n=1 Tax=Biomphalaria glabrata TaxID=6526 RepID=A0A2C9LQW8_BIOGL
MSMLPSNRGDDTVICPYDPAHVILKKSLQNHLIKCRENHKRSRKVTCKFNKTHIIPAPELSHHLQHCDSRSVFDRELQYQARQNQIFTGAINAPDITNHTDNLEEDWEAAPRVQTKALFNKNVYDVPEEETKPYVPPGATYVTKKQSQSHQVFDYSANNVMKHRGTEPSDELPRQSGSEVLSHTQPKFRFMGRGISRFDDQEIPTPGLLGLSSASVEVNNIPGHSPYPGPPPGFSFKSKAAANILAPFILEDTSEHSESSKPKTSLGFAAESSLACSSPTLAVRSVDFPTLNTAGHYASAATNDWTNAKSEQLQQKRERELRKLIDRQTEERNLLEARHHDELEQLMLRLDLEEKLAMM